MSLSIRLRDVRKSIKPKLSQEAFGNILGVSRDSIATYENGRVTPSDTFIQLLCSKFGIDEHWLRTGEGSMHAETEVEIVERLKAQYHMTDSQARLMDIFLSMDSEKREQVAAAFFNLVGEANKQVGHDDKQSIRDQAHVRLDQELDAAEQDASASHSTARKKA